jgi:hypothetical protein
MRAVIGASGRISSVAGLAQLVEQRFCKPKVAGSNPASGTIFAWSHAGSMVKPKIRSEAKGGPS